MIPEIPYDRARSMYTPAEVDAYLARIGFSGSRAPTRATLAALHRRHMQAVPFENLDIPLGRRITLVPDALWSKIILNRRGGFCYELNTLFGRLLQALGYHVDFLSARVWSAAGWGPDKDHMALRVEAEGAEWLADVGFGDSFLVPLRLEADVVQEAGLAPFRLQHEGGRWTMDVQDAKGDWSQAYRFTLDAHEPESFQTMCDYQQTSPDATFTRRVVCSRATERGRVSVTHDRLIVTTDGDREETPLADAVGLVAALATHHDIRLRQEDAEAIIDAMARKARSLSQPDAPQQARHDPIVEDSR